MFCPHPPLLVPVVAGSAATELDDLRAACRAAIATLEGQQLVVLGGGPASVVYAPLSRGTLAGFGVAGGGATTGGGAADLPLSLTVGAWLVHDTLGARSDVLGFSVGPEFAESQAAVELFALAQSQELAVLVMGDGSARRSTKAPGYLDERAAAFERGVATALAGGEAAALAGLDPELGADLLAAGVPAWRAAGAVLGRERYDAALTYDQAPYGVGYYVASWTAATAAGQPSA